MIGDGGLHARGRASGHLDAEVPAGGLGEQLEDQPIGLVPETPAARRQDRVPPPLVSHRIFAFPNGSTTAQRSHALPSGQPSASTVRDCSVRGSKRLCSSPSTCAITSSSASGSRGTRKGYNSSRVRNCFTSRSSASSTRTRRAGAPGFGSAAAFTASRWHPGSPTHDRPGACPHPDRLPARPGAATATVR